MSIHTKLYIDDIEYTVLKFDFDFQKSADVNGRPTTKYTGGLFNFTVESTNKSDIILWSVNPTEMKEIKLVISPNHGIGKSRTIILGDAICLQFTNEYFSEDNQPLKEYFTVSPGYMLQNGQIIFEKNWKRTDLTANVEETVISSAEEEHSRIIDYYITDLDGNRVNEILAGDEILLNVESENMIDKKMSINLENKTLDFKFNGEVLIDDSLNDIIINLNHEKIKLLAVKQEV